MNIYLILASPLFVIFFKWTVLLVLGWATHWVLRNSHARWRLILWRSILCFGLVLPLMQFIEVPGIKIPINNNISVTQFDNPLVSDTAVTAIHSLATKSQPVKTPIVATSAVNYHASLSIKEQSSKIPWVNLLVIIWAAGGAWGAVRLLRLHFQLFRLQKRSHEPTSDLQQQATHIQIRLQVRKMVAVLISSAVASPFVCGLLKPTIILPQGLTQQLSKDEMSALLSHEIAHLRQHDLHWCIAWRWMKAVCWFHPCVWSIPAAHNLACEQEADRIASGDSANDHSYAQMLARLALQVLALPPVETKLTANGSSQIARRLNHLGRKGIKAWNWKYSLKGFGLVGFLFLMTVGCEFSHSTQTNSKTQAKVKFNKVLVVVQDEDGKPIEGATIFPTGFRVKGIHGADAYGWITKLFGPPEKAVTDGEGKAYVKYPVEGIPEEKEFTGALILSFSHPDFASVLLQSYSVDESEKPVQLTHGIHLEISGYIGKDHQPVPELIPNLNEEIIHQDDWLKETNSTFGFNKLSPGTHLIQLMGRLPTGEIVYSDSFSFTAVKGKDYSFALEMKPGIRVEGRIDDQVPRPVKNGRVLISVRTKEFPAWNNYADVEDILNKYPNVRNWQSYRPIAEDGTFTFESVPPGSLDVIVLGDGFASHSGGDFERRDGSKLIKVHDCALPQAFPLVAPMTKIEVVTERTATLELTAKTKQGMPIEGVSIYLNPNVVRMGGIFGNMRKSSEAPFVNLPPLSDVPYSAMTDRNGFVVIHNVPSISGSMEVEHPTFQMPLQDPKGWRDRNIRMTFSAGATNRYQLILEPKGADFIGKN